MKRTLSTALAIAATVVIVPLAVPADAAGAQRDVALRSFDGTVIAAHFFRADGLTTGKRAPVVMVAHGYGEKGPATRDEKLLGAADVDSLLKAGYNVLSWDARGHGSSGGVARFDSPDVEVRDTRMLISWLAKQPEVRLDAPGDPRVGMTGASYGGIIQFNTAGVDRRVDAISPAYTGHSLTKDMIAPRGRFKETWTGFLVAATAQTVPPGVLSPTGPYVHSPDPEATDGLARSYAAGTLTPELRAYLDYRSPSRFVGRIRIPTLLQEGTTDGLFPLVNAERNYRVLRTNGVPVKMVWNCEGHSYCSGDPGPAGRFTKTVIRWFDRWLKRDSAVSTGRGFEWLADNEGTHRGAAKFPAPSAGTLRGTGAGTLSVSPASPSATPGMIAYGSTPSSEAVNVDITAAKSADIVGHPTVTISYTGTAQPAKTYLYGQLVDVTNNRVVGGMTTPIPVTLDGTPHTTTVNLESIASHAAAGSKYRVQIFAGTLTYGQQRSIGTAELTSVTAALPLVYGAR